MMTQEKRPIGFKQNIDKILFLLATGYLIFITAWFLKPVKTKTNSSVNTTIKTKTVVEDNLSSQNDDAIVLNSNQEQAENIEVKAESNPISVPILKKPLPSISDFKSRENRPIPAQSLPVIPVSSLPPISSLSSSSPPVVNNSSSLPQPLQVPIPPPPKAPRVSRVTSLPVLNSQKNEIAYQQETSLPSPSDTKNIQQPQQTSFNYNYSLVGLIQLDDQSDLALFTINNSTQRVKVGEEIGASGWILVSINEKQAIINQLGENVHLTIGDKF